MKTNSTVSRSLRGGAALRALMLCGAGASAALFAGPAFAPDTPAADAAPAPQDDQAASTGDIVVTGTLLRSPITASPVTTLTNENLDQRGISTGKHHLRR